MIQISSPYIYRFPQKNLIGIENGAENEVVSEGVSVLLNKDSSPYNDALSTKDNNEVKNTVDNKAFSEDAILVINQFSSPYNKITPPKR